MGKEIARGAVLLVFAVALSLVLFTFGAFNSVDYSIVGNPEVLVELSRLTGLANAGALDEGSLSALEELAKGDAVAGHEVEELKLLARHGEKGHALHALGALSFYVSKGKKLLCPSHELLHYYVFSRHGEEEFAVHSLEHFAELLKEWEPLALASKEKAEVEKTLGVLDARLRDIRAGKVASEGELQELDERELCVSSRA